MFLPISCFSSICICVTKQRRSNSCKQTSCQSFSTKKNRFKNYISHKFHALWKFNSQSIHTIWITHHFSWTTLTIYLKSKKIFCWDILNFQTYFFKASNCISIHPFRILYQDVNVLKNGFKNKIRKNLLSFFVDIVIVIIYVVYFL